MDVFSVCSPLAEHSERILLVGKDEVLTNDDPGVTDLSPLVVIGHYVSDLGVRGIRLLTNNPRKVVGLDGYGLHIVERVPIQVPANENNARYLKTKKDKLGHILDDVE